ncbi:NUDIX hydrolase [Patescibacteria group bacterium]|nr:NUDIX hydrolase [Patescibacteria group bacterium]
MKKWKTIKSKVVFDCKYLKIVEEDFLLSDKKSDKYFLVERLDFVVIIARNGNNLYLIKQSRYTTKIRLIEFVAGAIEKGETPLKAAKRELEEEAGIKAKKFQSLGWYWANKGCSKQKGYVFLAENLSFIEHRPDEIESEGEIETVSCKLSEVRKMIESGKIKDNDSLAAFSFFMLKCNS